jgi:hypothetical protein
MNNMMQMIMNNLMNQAPQKMTSQLEQQLKRISPQAYQEYQQARKNNNPEELLNQTVNGFNPQQRQQWDSMMGGLQPQNKQQNTQEQG